MTTTCGIQKVLSTGVTVFGDTPAKFKSSSVPGAKPQYTGQDGEICINTTDQQMFIYDSRYGWVDVDLRYRVYRFSVNPLVVNSVRRESINDLRPDPVPASTPQSKPNIFSLLKSWSRKRL